MGAPGPPPPPPHTQPLSSPYSPSSYSRAPYSSHHHHHHHHHYQGPPPSSTSIRHPHVSSTPHPTYRSYQHHHSHNPQPPARPRQSWAPEVEKELERYHAEDRKSCAEEIKVLATTRKSRFELELANWETSKLDHQLELVQKQYDEYDLEELINSELRSKTAGKAGRP